QGAVWLSEDLCSPYQFYQYLLRVPDQDVIHLLKVLTFLDLEEIKELEASMQNPHYEPNALQKRLAKEVTLIVHGEEGLDKAIKATQAANSFDPELLDAVIDELPHCEIPLSKVEGRLLVDIFVESGFLPSKGEAKRLIKSQGAYINGEKILDEQKTVAKEDILQGNKLVLGSGKKKKFVVFLSES
ncbi:MAG: tyrosine--tRNA ligase, partial [Chlamydiae bacterium]|nr:tyrosine--tRNA ligase [Chlamydiota bacterium]